jgi:GDP-D-mannose 3',5'-epimerase
VRFHNIFGPLGTWEGGREKALAALCRKVAEAKLTGDPEVEIWGDGEQTRSFCYIDDCVAGIYKLMRSDYYELLNLGQDRLVTINQLADMIADIAGIRIVKKHVPGPQGVRGRNSDNTRLRQVLGCGNRRFGWKMGWPKLTSGLRSRCAQESDVVEEKRSERIA